MKHKLPHIRSLSEGSVAVLPFNPNAQLALSPYLSNTSKFALYPMAWPSEN